MFTLPDVNGAVDTIGGLHDVDVEELRVSLIQEWLQSGSGEATLDLDQVGTCWNWSTEASIELSSVTSIPPKLLTLTPNLDLYCHLLFTP